MTIHTDYYGEVEYEKEDLVFFADGLFGFPELRYYLPLYLEDGDESVILMQSTENPDISFVTMNPMSFYQDYQPCLKPEELSILSAQDSGDLSYYVICVMKEDYLDNTVNLKCPLVINPGTRTGMQVILEGSHYGFQHRLGSFVNADSENRGDTDAGSTT